jgi:cytochrome P450
MKEAMRLHPGVGFPLERKVPEGGATICGVSLPGDTIISMSAPVVHVDISIFGKDAAQFRPERWLDGDEEQLKVMERSLLTVCVCTSWSSIPQF